jgi:hypothetical protein
MALAPSENANRVGLSNMDSGAATLACNNASGVGRAGTETLKVDGNVVSTQKALRP